MPISTAAFAAVVAARNKYVRAFRKAGATDSEHGRTLAELGLSDSIVFRGMVRRGYVAPAPTGFYLDDERFQQRRQQIRRTALFALLATALWIGVVLLFSGR